MNTFPQNFEWIFSAFWGSEPLSVFLSVFSYIYTSPIYRVISTKHPSVQVSWASVRNSENTYLERANSPQSPASKPCAEESSVVRECEREPVNETPLERVPKRTHVQPQNLTTGTKRSSIPHGNPVLENYGKNWQKFPGNWYGWKLPGNKWQKARLKLLELSEYYKSKPGLSYQNYPTLP